MDDDPPVEGLKWFLSPTGSNRYKPQLFAAVSISLADKPDIAKSNALPSE